MYFKYFIQTIEKSQTNNFKDIFSSSLRCLFFFFFNYALKKEAKVINIYNKKNWKPFEDTMKVHIPVGMRTLR